MKRSLMNLGHEFDLSFNMGELIPLAVVEGLPGDIWRHSTSLLVRTQPLLAPLMHKVDVTIHHYFVPLRLIWEDFENFMTGGQDGEDEPAFPVLQVPSTTGFEIGSLADYLGIPTGPDAESQLTSALKFRAYNDIWNNYYRDPQLQNELVVSRASGTDVTTSTALQYGCWDKDYFTSCRPEPQLGSEVIIPLAGDAPVVFRETGTTPGTRTFVRNSNSAGTPMNLVQAGTSGQPIVADAELDATAAVDVNTLRLSSAVQIFKEKLNRGNRYVEMLWNFFKVRPQDSRLQLPEYLGGGRFPIQFSEVLNTTALSDVSDPLGTLGGHGIAAGRSNRYKFFVPEFGFIVTLACVRPKTMYMQGFHKSDNRRSRYDFFNPVFAHLGDQEVLKKEIYAGAADPEGTFGFTPRWDEYRYLPNRVAGEFKSTLDYWHMARIFSTEPALNADFVKSNPTDRVFPISVSEADQLQVRCFHKMKVRRPMPKVAKPRLM